MALGGAAKDGHSATLAKVASRIRGLAAVVGQALQGDVVNPAAGAHRMPAQPQWLQIGRESWLT